MQIRLVVISNFSLSTALIRPSVPPSGSHKCLRFGLWSTLHTLKDLFIYLLA